MPTEINPSTSLRIDGERSRAIKNLKKAALRILKAIKNKEKIVLYGDADLDGIGSVIILKQTIENLGGKVSAIYFPDREKEGYGINERALFFLKKYTPALFIALDCGMSNIQEVDLAKKMGFEVMIIDHHQALSKLPKASIIVNPKQKNDPYPFKELSCAGIIYKLAKSLFSQGLPKKYEFERFLELVLFATLADHMPLVEENRALIKEGILALKYTKRPGIRALMELTNFRADGGIEEIRRKILPPLSACESEDHSSKAYLLLVEEDFEKAKNLAKISINKAEKRREGRRKIFIQLEEKIRDLAEPIVFEGDASWPLIFTGAVASKICQKYKKPTFLYRKGKAESQGHMRVPSGIDGVKAMMNCESLLKTYGGHPQAGGFRIKNENLEKFKKCLIEYFSKL